MAVAETAVEERVSAATTVAAMEAGMVRVEDIPVVAASKATMHSI